jgi:hypothetical protein
MKMAETHLLLNQQVLNSLGLAPMGTGTMALDPTFGSFIVIRTSFTHYGFFGESASTL